MKKIFLCMIAAAICMFRLSVTAQTTYNSPRNVNYEIELSEGKYQVTLSWDEPQGTTQSENPEIIYNTAVYNDHCKLVKTFVHALDKFLTINEDSIVIQSMEYFNNNIYAVETQTYFSCGGTPIEICNLGILDPVEGTIDVIQYSTIENQTGMAWNPINGKIYISLGKPFLDTNFGVLNLNSGYYESITYFETLATIAIDNDGICYGLTYDNKFGVIDLTNGDFIEIATLPVEMLMKCQNLAIDRSTNELYWAARLVGSDKCPLYQINKTTGDLTVIGYFPEGIDFQVQSFTILSSIPLMYHVYRDGEKLTEQPISSLTYTDTSVSETETYQYCITAVYDYFYESNPVCKDVTVCNTCQTITEITTETTSESITIKWEYDNTETSFDVYRNDVFLENTTTSHYTDNTVSYNETYIYCIIPIQQCCENVKTCSPPVVLTNIAEKETDTFAVFPNPASKTIIIKGKNITKVMIYNSLGQSVAKFECTKNDIIHDISLYPEGLYFLQICSKDNVTVSKRLLIAR